MMLFAGLALTTGCKGVTTRGEREARYQAGVVKAAYRPNDQRPGLPNLTTNSSLGDFLTYAMLNQPQIETTYYDWAASVETITVSRSLPDPQFTFQMYIQDVITSVMPGLMAQIPWPGKLRVQAESDPNVLKALDLMGKAKELADNARKTIAEHNQARLAAPSK